MDGIAWPKAVFFDWDGTLVDTFLFLHRAHNHVRGVFDLGSFTIEEFSHYFGKPRELLYAQIYGVERIETAKKHFEAFVIANHDQIQAMPGAADLLATLHDLAVPMGVVTNKKGDLVRKEIIHHGWGDYFISVVGAGEAAADKPSSAPLVLALSLSGLDVDMGDVWFVGDTDNDLQCGVDAGALNVFITNGEDQDDLIAQHKPELVFEGCGELNAFLLQTGNNRLQQKADTA